MEQFLRFRLRQEGYDVGIRPADFDDGANNVVDLVSDAALFVDAVARLVLLNDDAVFVASNGQSRIRFQIDDPLQIDLFGSFRVARAVAKQAMIPARYGRVINIASMYGLVGNKIAPCSPYHAAKGGVVNLTRGLAAEWGKYGITVNTICPGYFYTPLTVETLNSDYFQDYAKRVIPLERYGNEGELDTAVLFLSSPASGYVTGAALPVDGGYTCV